MPGKEYSEVAPSEEVADKAATPSGGSVASRCDPGPCIRDSKHPWVAFFHIFFKVMALFIYVFGTYFSSNFVLIFVMCILMLAMDFWTVQNVSGRLLVGLRWWNEIKEDGTSDWRFESIRDPSSLVASDATLFWAALVAAPVLWGLFAMSALISLKLSWLLIVGIAVSLNCSNLIGYFKCRKDAGKQLQGLMAQGALQAVSSGQLGGLMGATGWAGTGGASGNNGGDPVSVHDSNDGGWGDDAAAV